jgi:hypothetical protein
MGMNMASRNLHAPELTRPTVQDLQEGNRWVQTAKTRWLKDAAVRRAKHDVIKEEIWDGLESESFAQKSLLILENLQILERYVARSMAFVPCSRLQVPLAELERRCVELSCAPHCNDSRC